MIPSPLFPMKILSNVSLLERVGRRWQTLVSEMCQVDKLAWVHSENNNESLVIITFNESLVTIGKFL